MDIDIDIREIDMPLACKDSEITEYGLIRPARCTEIRVPYGIILPITYMRNKYVTPLSTVFLMGTKQTKAVALLISTV